jgi:type II secretion system protein H
LDEVMKIRMTHDEIRKPHACGIASSFGFRHSNFRRAFTLIELILVLALLVIITSIAAPTMSKFIRGRALDTEARRMMALMHLGQSRAVSEGLPMMLWLDAPSGAYGLQAETSGTAGDSKAEDLTVDSTLLLTVVNTGVSAPTMFNNFPAIKFLADGTIDENSPSALQLVDADGFGRVFTENKARTGYEVDSAK